MELLDQPPLRSHGRVRSRYRYPIPVRVSVPIVRILRPSYIEGLGPSRWVRLMRVPPADEPTKVTAAATQTRGPDWCNWSFIFNQLKGYPRLSSRG